jgi:hypothetical protein
VRDGDNVAILAAQLIGANHQIKGMKLVDDFICCVPSVFVSNYNCCITRVHQVLQYRISRPIRRTLIFSLEVLEKIVMNVF